MTRLLLVGCGKMGGALLAGWLDQGVAPANIIIVDPNLSDGATSHHADKVGWPKELRVFAAAADLPADFRPDVILLAVKPQTMEQVLPAYRHFTGSIFVSIAAGRTLRFLARSLGDKAAIVRAMPNTPAAVRRGVTVLLPNAVVSEDGKALCESLMAAVGEVAWIDKETEMDAVTAISGSGPAYVFLMVEAMAAAGETLGLTSELARTLARATVIGAGELLRQSPQSAATLRENVTSPNGTTFAALQVLGAPGGLTDLLQRAAAAAARRAQELAG